MTNQEKAAHRQIMAEATTVWCDIAEKHLFQAVGESVIIARGQKDQDGYEATRFLVTRMVHTVCWLRLLLSGAIEPKVVDGEMSARLIPDANRAADTLVKSGLFRDDNVLVDVSAIMDDLARRFDGVKTRNGS